MCKRKWIITIAVLCTAAVLYVFLVSSLQASIQIKKILQENMGAIESGYTYCLFDEETNLQIARSADYTRRHYGYYNTNVTKREFQMTFPIAIAFVTTGRCYYKYSYHEYVGNEEIYGVHDSLVCLYISKHGGRWNITEYFEEP